MGVGCKVEKELVKKSTNGKPSDWYDLRTWYILCPLFQCTPTYAIFKRDMVSREACLCLAPL